MGLSQCSSPLSPVEPSVPAAPLTTLPPCPCFGCVMPCAPRATVETVQTATSASTRHLVLATSLLLERFERLLNDTLRACNADVAQPFRAASASGPRQA